MLGILILLLNSLQEHNQEFISSSWRRTNSRSLLLFRRTLRSRLWKQRLSLPFRPMSIRLKTFQKWRMKGPSRFVEWEGNRVCSMRCLRHRKPSKALWRTGKFCSFNSEISLVSPPLQLHPLYCLWSMLVCQRITKRCLFSPAVEYRQTVARPRYAALVTRRRRWSTNKQRETKSTRGMKFMQVLVCFCIIDRYDYRSVKWCMDVTYCKCRCINYFWSDIVYNSLQAILHPHCLLGGPMTEQKVAARQQLRGDPPRLADYK